MKHILLSIFTLLLIYTGHAQTKADSCTMSIHVLYVDNDAWCVCPPTRADTCGPDQRFKVAGGVKLYFTCNNKDVVNLLTDINGDCSVTLKKDQYVISFQWPDGAKASTVIDLANRNNFAIDQGCETTLWGYLPDYSLCIMKRIHIPVPKWGK